MLTPPTITFKGLSSSPALEAEIQRQIGILETLNTSIMSCRVVVEKGHRHEEGNRYHITVDLSLPGEEIVVSHEPSLRATVLATEADKITKDIELAPEHKDVFLAVHDAFASAKRRLQRTTERHRGEVKPHNGRLRGRIVRLFMEEGYGFLEAEDGHEVYFHEHSVLKGRFGRLKIGDVVAFTEEEGDKGPQASTVVG